MKREEIKHMVEEIGAEEGDFIEVSDGKKTHRGILMPRHAFSGDDIMTLKLENGYNIGIRVGDESSVKLVEKKKGKKNKKHGRQYDKSKPSVALLGTGGTIASYVDYATGAVRPASTSEELALLVPEIFDICNVDAKIIFQKLSENITPRDWIKIAEKTADELNGGNEGVIIAHGTDTMGYTSAALSFMLKNLTGPVVLTGSQRSSDRPSSDSFQNLLAAARVATSDLGEIAVVMHGISSPGYCSVYRGTKVRKMHSSRRDAFRPINGRPIGFVDDKLHLITDYRRKSDGDTVADASLDTNVSLVYFHPGLSVDDFNKMTEGKDGVLIAGTGLGHVNGKMIPAIEELVKSGTTVVMTTQCIWGRVNMNVYATGRRLVDAGVISGKDMLPETALVKMMWVLAHFEGDEIGKMMGENIAGEISGRTYYDTYPEQKKYIV